MADKQHPGAENLRPVQSKEEARARGRLGGLASGKARRRKRALRETAMAIRDTVIPGDPAGRTYGEAAVFCMFEAAIMAGNVQAFNALVDLLGERVERHQVDVKEVPRIVFQSPATVAKNATAHGAADGH